MKTKEELQEEIEIHKKSNAWLKVEILEKELARLEPSDKFVQDVVDTIIEMEDQLKKAYDLSQHTDASWKEITAITGVNTPWKAVKKYAKDNNLPYRTKK